MKRALEHRERDGGAGGGAPGYEQPTRAAEDKKVTVAEKKELTAAEAEAAEKQKFNQVGGACHR